MRINQFGLLVAICLSMMACNGLSGDAIATNPDAGTPNDVTPSNQTISAITGNISQVDSAFVANIVWLASTAPAAVWTEFGTDPNFNMYSVANSTMTTGATTGAILLPSLVANGNYSYRVKAVVGNTTITSTTGTFATPALNTLPQTQLQVTSVVGSVTQTSANITWLASQTPSSIWVEHSTDPQFGTFRTTIGQVPAGAITGNITLTDGIVPNTGFFYRVKTALNGQTLTHNAGSFTTLAANTVPTTSETITAAQGVPTSTSNTFVWTASPAALTQVELQYGTDSSLNSRTIVSGTPGTSGTFNLGGLNPSTTYYWRIYGLVGSTPVMSAIQQFTTIADNTVPTISETITAAQGVPTASGNNFVWVSSPAPLTQVEIRYGTDSTLSARNNVAGTPGSSGAFNVTGLASATTYYWQIAGAAGANQVVTPIASFITDAAGTAPSVNHPTHYRAMCITSAQANCTPWFEYWNANNQVTIKTGLQAQVPTPGLEVCASTLGAQVNAYPGDQSLTWLGGSVISLQATYDGGLTWLQVITQDVPFGNPHNWGATWDNLGCGTQMMTGPVVATGTNINTPPTTAQSITAAQNVPTSTSNTFVWTASPAALTQVELQYGTDSTLNSHASVSGTTGTNGTFVVSGLVPATTYYWRVSGFVGSTQAQSAIQQFTTLAANTVPTTSETITAAQGVPTSTSNTFVWTASPAALTQVELQYGTDSSLNSRTIVSGTPGTSGTFNLGGLNPSTTYYWRIYGLVGSTPVMSAIQQFVTLATGTTGQFGTTTITPPTASSVQLIPQQNADGSVSLIWVYLPGFRSTQANFGTNSNLAAPVQAIPGTSGQFGKIDLPLQQPTAPTTYYYNVVGTDTAGNPVQSGIGSVMVYPFAQVITPVGNGNIAATGKYEIVPDQAGYSVFAWTYLTTTDAEVRWTSRVSLPATEVCKSGSAGMVSGQGESQIMAASTGGVTHVRVYDPRGNLILVNGNPVLPFAPDAAYRNRDGGRIGLTAAQLNCQ